MYDMYDCKVLCDEHWYPGRLIERMKGDIYHVEVCPGTPKAFKRRFDSTEYTRWEQISDEAIQQATLNQMDDLKEFLQKVIDKMMPGEQFHVDPETCTISMGGGAVTMTPIAFEYRAIGAIRQKPGWSVETWHSTPASRDCPEDVSESEQGRFPNYSEAVKCLIATLFKIRLENYYDALASEAMANDLA